MHRRKAYTLVEILVATTLSLVMLAAVMQVFATVSANVSNSRAITELSAQLRLTMNRLKDDLGGATASSVMGPPPVQPPGDPTKSPGYLEIIEGPIGPVIDPGATFASLPSPNTVFVDSTNALPDTTVGDVDDILMLTVQRPAGEAPFVGRWGFKRTPLANELPMIDSVGPYVIDTNPVTSQYAEVIWFIRGRTLHRRVLLIVPGYENYTVDVRPAATAVTPMAIGANWAQGFYGHTDISALGQFKRRKFLRLFLKGNTLGDLTNRENRYAHGSNFMLMPAQNPGSNPGALSNPNVPNPQGTDFPFDARRWGQMGMPTLRECSYYYYNPTPPPPSNSWIAGNMLPQTMLNPLSQFDLWANPYPWTDVNGNPVDPNSGDLAGYLGARAGEDIILDNCIGFDIKVWDPNAPLVQDPVSGSTLAPGDRVLNGTDYVSLLSKGTTPVGFGAFADLNYMCRLGPASGYTSNPWAAPPAYQTTAINNNYPIPYFYDAGDYRSRLRGADPNLSPDPTVALVSPTKYAAVYDTGSNFYETDGINEGDWAGSSPSWVIDDAKSIPGALEAPPPYAKPLQAIQVKIRMFEPGSKQVREVTVVQKFF